MKRLVIFLLLSLIVASSGCASQTTATLKPLATTLADKFGRTAANAVVEFQSCGVTVCTYYVYFTTLDDFAVLNVRAKTVADEVNLSTHDGKPNLPGAGGEELRRLNDDLSTTSIKGRLTVVTSGVDQEPPATAWVFTNAKGERAATMTLFRIRESGISYAFDGKPLQDDLLLIQTSVDLNQP